MRRRCGICGRFLKLTELLGHIGQRGPLTYPSRYADGSRSEFSVSYLCDKCRERAVQYRQENPDVSTRPLTPRPAPPPRSRSGRAEARRERQRQWIIGGVAGVLLVGGGVLLSQRLGTSGRSTANRKASSQSKAVSSKKVATPKKVVAQKAAPPPKPVPPQQSVVAPKSVVPPKDAPPAVSIEPATVVSVTTLPREQLDIRVSTTTPARSRGFWITVVVPPEERRDGVQPLVELQDAKHRRFLLKLKPNGVPGEWTSRSGLDEAGRWTGRAILRGGKRKLTAKLPDIEVQP